MTTVAEKTATWPQAEATVVSSTPHSCNFAAGGGHHEQEYSISFRYDVAGQRYDAEFECNRPWEVGSTYCISYDPTDPETNTMCDHKGERWVYYLLAVAAILAFVAYFWVRYSRLHV